VRYEDLVIDMSGPTTGIMEYLLDLDSLAGTNAERRIKEHCAKGKEATRVYQVKGTTGVANAHAKRFTEG